jgi:hypothetical protein
MQKHIKKTWWSLMTVVLLVFISQEEVKAQRFAVSTNALEWLTLSPNLSFDMAFSQHHAFSMSASASPWKISDNLHLQHITVSPEYRYWFRMPFYGHFMGANLIYSSYDFSLGGFDRRNDLLAAGVTYGYSLMLGKRWNIVPVIGLGAGVEVADKIRVVPAVTRLGVNIQLVVK